MRGTHATRLKAIRESGIIPAYAGNTRIFLEQRKRLRDHPRVCGEHTRSSLVTCIPAGSSPRMRGTPSGSKGQYHQSGIIPAYAGNTYYSRCEKTFPRDHPRVCGEHTAILKSLIVIEGSSPRMRGTPYQLITMPIYIGIIPAYAGNTCLLPVHTAICRDHPRVCGEHPMRCTSTCMNSGSSPRMRGTLGQHGRLRPNCGIIPAYAGNTF